MAEVYESWKNWASGLMGTAAAPVQTAAPSIATTQGSTTMLGTAREKSGYTSTGGRRRGAGRTRRVRVKKGKSRRH
jgi:hypothetical protein